MARRWWARPAGEAHPALHALRTMIAAAIQANPAAQHANPSLDPRAEAVTSAEPALPLVAGAFASPLRDGNAAHPLAGRARLLVVRRPEAAIRRQQVRRMIELCGVVADTGEERRRIGRIADQDGRAGNESSLDLVEQDLGAELRRLTVSKRR